MIGHELVLVPIKPWGAWQAKCECRRFAGSPQMSRPEAIREHTLHVAQVQGIVSRREQPVIIMREAHSPARAVPAVNVERVMARLIGPASVLVLAWWVLWCGGVFR